MFPTTENADLSWPRVADLSWPPLLDTRPGGATIDGLSHRVKVATGGEIAPQVTGRGGVPVDATAVALNVTVTAPEAASRRLVTHHVGRMRQASQVVLSEDHGADQSIQSSSRPSAEEHKAAVADDHRGRALSRVLAENSPRRSRPSSIASRWARRSRCRCLKRALDWSAASSSALACDPASHAREV